ncbi:MULTISPECIES: TetR/AcrR family transcriptional regulator [Emticicia]|uniref:TetR/AcrR family transcriptional regulator n=1 Tax=Emticicia TaxID=312278 RepID=UPI00209F1FD8|nr:MULTISPECIES: TetR/AcrR family transcriptional regulator [Emticicia]UTA66391.1 TetR/AcrR family transcriptional regulator [Emticicia sp. 21SJ11W-3]
MEKDELVIQDIIKGAKKLMQQYGLKKTTMEDIAKAAGKSKSTLYYYFKDKEEIFDRVINLEIDEFFYSVKTAVNEQPDSICMLKAYIVTKVKAIKEKVNLYSLVVENDLNGRLNEEYSNLRNRYDHEEKHLLESILAKGVETGQLKEEILENLDLLSDLMVSCIRGIELDIIARKKNTALADKADLLVDMIIKGMGR